MFKFKKGDKVVSLVTENCIKKGMVGIVLENNSACPYVEWQDLTMGHDRPYNDGRKSCWALTEREMELLNEKFKVGDKVRLITDRLAGAWKLSLNSTGTIMAVRDIPSPSYTVYTVRFDNWHKGHDGNLGYRDHSCLFINSEDLTLIPEKKKEKFKFNIVIYRKDNKVIAQLHNGKCVYASAEAKCSPNDTFNYAVGSQIALQRLCRKMGDGTSAIVIPEDLRLNELFMY